MEKERKRKEKEKFEASPQGKLQKYNEGLEKRKTSLEDFTREQRKIIEKAQEMAKKDPNFEGKFNIFVEETMRDEYLKTGKLNKEKLNILELLEKYFGK